MFVFFSPVEFNFISAFVTMTEQNVTQMISALTEALQGLSVQRTPPPVKLTKFKGRPKAAGDLSLQEWLDEFASYVRHYNLTGEDKAQALLDNLAGVAKEEIVCRKVKVPLPGKGTCQ